MNINQWKVLSMTKSSVVHEIEMQARQHQVSITYPTFESSSIIIFGHSSYVTQVKERFEDLKKWVFISSRKVQYTPGLWTVLRSMKDSICLLEHECNVSVAIKATASSCNETDSEPSRVILAAVIDECKIEICFGNFVQHPSTTSIINLLVQNIDQHHLHELIAAGGREVYSDIHSRMKELSSCVLPQVFETKSHSLLAEKLICCMVLKWNPNDSGTAKVIQQGIEHAMISSAPPNVVINHVAPIQCPSKVLVEIITKAIKTNSHRFSGFTFALYVKTKEELKNVEHFFRDRHIQIVSNNPIEHVEHSKIDEEMYIHVLESGLLSFFSVTHGNILEQKVYIW